MSIQKVEMTVEQKENGQYVEQVAYPFVEYDHVAMENGMDIMSMIRDDVSTPMVTHNTTSWKVGQGDSDVSETIVDSSVGDMTIKGQTYQNILPSPSLRNSMTDGTEMQKINEGYDSVSTVDGVYKSAILKGQTLVNLNKITYPVTAWSVNTNNNNYYRDNYTLKSGMIRPSTKYLFKVYGLPNVHEVRLQGTTSTFVDTQGQYRFNGKGSLIMTSTENIQDYSQFIPHFKRDTVNNLTTEEMNNFKMIILEYQDGMENWDIPYFEGIQSVKLPVLTTTGKNSFDGELVKNKYYNGSTGELVAGNNNLASVNPIRVNPNTSIVLSTSANLVNNNHYICEYASDGTFIKRTNSSKITTSETTYFIKFHFAYETINESPNVQLEEGSTATSYEPYKSNILTVNEDVELRGIGKVKDELNVVNGELTQRIGEVVLNGEEDWRLQTSSTELRGKIYRLSISDISTSISNTKTNCISDKAKSGSWSDILNTKTDKTFAILQNQQLRVQFDGTVEELKEWLKETTPTVKYIKEKVIKTVDLTILDQDNQPVAQLNSFANGYIQVSSQEGTLTPTTEYEVPTSNSYYVDLMKANTQYTMKNMQGTFTIDGIQYNASVNDTFTSPSTLSNRLMITNVVQTQPMLLEGDMTSEEVPYVEGNKSAFEGVDKVEIVSQNADNSLSNTTSFQLAHPLRSLPNSVRDEIVLDRVNHKAKIIQRVGEDLTQLDTPIVTEVNLEGYPYVYKGGHIFLNTEIAPTTEVTYSINQAHQIESSNEDILRHQKEINYLYELIAQYVQVQYEAELIDIALQG